MIDIGAYCLLLLFVYISNFHSEKFKTTKYNINLELLWKTSNRQKLKGQDLISQTYLLTFINF